MTHRKYGEWPGWMIEAGWIDEVGYPNGGYYFAMLSKFDGEHETLFELQDIEDRTTTTPETIETWLLWYAKKWPEITPPPGFIADLRGDKGVKGFHLTVKYKGRN